VRKITPAQTSVFMLLFAASGALAVATAWILGRSIPPGDFRGVAIVIACVVLLYA